MLESLTLKFRCSHRAEPFSTEEAEMKEPGVQILGLSSMQAVSGSNTCGPLKGGRQWPFETHSSSCLGGNYKLKEVFVSRSFVNFVLFHFNLQNTEGRGRV